MGRERERRIIVIDFIVLAISIVVWLSHLASVAAAAIFVALFGAWYAIAALRDKRNAVLKSYGTVSVILSGIGLAAASADFAAAGGL